jgi:hypothetical protein
LNGRCRHLPKWHTRHGSEFASPACFDPQIRRCPFRLKTGKAQREHMFSAVQPITDITKLERHVRKVPGTEVAASFSTQKN